MVACDDLNNVTEVNGCIKTTKVNRCMRVCVYGSNSTQAFVQKSNKTFNIALINWRKAGLGGNKSVSTQRLCVCVSVCVQ